MNPFGARAVRLFLREVRDSQAKARGITYEKKKRRRPLPAVEGAATMLLDGAENGGGELNLDNGSHYMFSHGHFTITQGSGSGGSGDDDLVMVADSHTGALIPLSVFN